MAKDIWQQAKTEYDRQQSGQQTGSGDDVWAAAMKDYEAGATVTAPTPVTIRPQSESQLTGIAPAEPSVWATAAEQYRQEQQKEGALPVFPVNIFSIVAMLRGEKAKGKTLPEAAIHGFRRGGVLGVKSLAGLAQMAGEFLEPTPKGKPVSPALTRFWRRVSEPLKNWGKGMSAAASQYLLENPQEAMQLESTGFLNQTKEFLSKPELILQGGLESSTLVLEGALGTILGGPAGGIAVMAPPIAGEVYTDARKEGNSPKTALARAWATGIGEAAIEQWTLNKKFGLMRRMTTKTPLRKAIWEGVKLYARGTAEEGSQEFNRNFWRWVFTDRNQQWTENIGEAAAAGGPLELAMGGAFAGIGVTGRMVSNPDKISRVNHVRRIVTQSEKLTDKQRQEINETCDEVVKDVEAGVYTQQPTVDQMIGAQYGLSAEEVDKWLSDAEIRYRQIKRKPTEQRTKAEKKELAFLSRNRQDIEALLDYETQPGKVAPTKRLKPKRSKEVLEATQRKIIEDTGLTHNDMADLAEAVVGKRDIGQLNNKEHEKFITALEEAHGSPVTISPEDFELPIQVAGKSTTMASILNRANETANTLPDIRKIPKTVPRGFGRKGRGAYTWAKDIAVGIDNSPIWHLARIIDQSESGVYSEVFTNNIENGRKKQAQHTRSVHYTARELLDGVGVTPEDLYRMSYACNPRLKFLQKAGLTTPVELQNVEINGRSYQLTWGDLIDFYLSTNQEDGLRHILGGGLRIEGINTGPLSKETVADLRNKVETNDKAIGVANMMLNIGEKIWKPNINEVSLRLDGEEIATIPDWWGLSVYTPRYLAGKKAALTKDKGPAEINLIENKSIFRDRTESTAPLVVRDAFQKFTAFESGIAEYVGMAEPTRIARTLLNDNTLTAELERKGYGKVRSRMLNILKRAQSKSVPQGSLLMRISHLLPAIYRGILAANPRVVISQFMSSFNYGVYASPKYVSEIPKGLNFKNSEETRHFSDIAWDRFYMGHSSLEMGEMARSDAALRFWTGKIEDKNILGWGLKYADSFALTAGMEIAKAEYRDAQNGIISGLSAEWWATKDVSTQEGSVEWRKAITERSEWLWQRTQPSWDKWGRSEITSKKGVERVFFLFRSFHEKALTDCREALLDYNNSAKTPMDKARAAQRIGAVLTGYTVNALVRAALTALMAHKIKEPMEYLIDLGTAWTSMFPVFGSELQRSIRAFAGAATKSKTGYVGGEAIEALPFELVNTALSTARDFSDFVGHTLAEGEEEDKKAKEALARASKKLAISVGILHGIPSYEIKRLKEGWFTSAEDEPVKP